jgi:hypothetical protein
MENEKDLPAKRTFKEKMIMAAKAGDGVGRRNQIS